MQTPINTPYQPILPLTTFPINICDLPQQQFSQAGDMNKLRLETTILISDRPTDDIDDQVPILPIHPHNTPYQYTLIIHPINTPS